MSRSSDLGNPHLTNGLTGGQQVRVAEGFSTLYNLSVTMAREQICMYISNVYYSACKLSDN